MDIGGGLSAWLHTILYADSGGTLPRGSESGIDSGQAGPLRSVVNDPLDRATRLANIILAWNIFQHFYPYFDTVEVDWLGELSHALEGAAVNGSECEHLETLRRMVAALDDGHGTVSHLCDSRTGHSPVGLGWIDGFPTVVHLDDPSVGLASGDRILSIGGRSAAEMIEELLSRISTATPQWGSFRTMQELLKGPLNSEVVVRVESVSGDTAEIALPRTATSPPATESRPSPTMEVTPGIWYIDFGRLTVEEWDAILPELATASGIVFDVRGYPSNVPETVLGHLTRNRLHSPQWHIPVARLPDRQGTTFQVGGWTIEPREPFLNARRAFLADGRAISAAETLLGIVEYHQLGEIVGEATAGTNGNINPFLLHGGYSVRWTGMKVLKQDGSQHHGVGILPTVPVSRTRAGVAAGIDELLDRALELVGPN